MGDELKVYAWDENLAFSLFCIGLNCTEIADQVGICARQVERVAKTEDWTARRNQVQKELAVRTGCKVGKEQEFVRGVESQYGRKLLGLAETELRQWKPGKATLLDIQRLIELGTTLLRRGAGMPLNSVEITQTYDIGEGLQSALERAYAGHPELGGSLMPAQVIDLPAEPSSSTQPPKP